MAESAGVGRGWRELERSWEKIERLRQLLYASHHHLEQRQARQERLAPQGGIERVQRDGRPGDTRRQLAVGVAR